MNDNLLQAAAVAVPLLGLIGRMRKHQKRRAGSLGESMPHPLDTSYRAALLRAQAIATRWQPAYVTKDVASGRFYTESARDFDYRPRPGEKLVKKVEIGGFGNLGRSHKTAAVAMRLHKYVDPCMKRYHNKGYCWRVAWSVYCSHINPKYPGCTK